MSPDLRKGTESQRESAVTPHCVFRVVRSEDLYLVRLETTEHEVAESPLHLDFGPSSRLMREKARIESNYAQLDHLRDIGSQLWAALVSGPVGELFERVGSRLREANQHYHLRLSLPTELDPLPWETFYDEKRRGFLVNDPALSVIRNPPDAIDPPSIRERRPGPLRVLVAIPEGSGLQVGREWRNLRTDFEKLGEAIDPELLDGLVTPDRLEQSLAKREWDVFHFVGHGQVDPQGKVRIRLNDETASDRALWMEAETFSALFQGTPTQLAVLNCCLGAHPSPSRSLSGLGPFLLRAGLRAVVAMRYEISDEEAIRFSESFYRELLEGREGAGRVDAAVTKARRALHFNARDVARGFVTPVLYMLEGFTELKGLPGAPLDASTGTVRGATSESSSPRIPAELMEAVRERRAIPVVGRQLLTAAATRGSGTIPGPLELARILGERFEYPDHDELRRSELVEDWVGEQLLQRVCQHSLYHEHKKGFRLLRALQEVFRTATVPPPLMEIARWDVKGIVYPGFDGLMSEALRRVGKSARELNYVDRKVDVLEETLLLVHLRGTLSDAESLVLTEEDNERLWERMSGLSQSVANLVLGDLGRTLVFLGVSPRDPLIRRFVNRVLPAGPTVNLGPMFFVTPIHSKADEAYWSRFGVEWIDDNADAVVRTVTETLRNGSG